MTPREPKIADAIGFGPNAVQAKQLLAITAYNMQICMGESPAYAKMLAQQWHQSRDWSIRQLALVGASTTDKTMARSDAIDFPGIEQLGYFLRNKTNGIVLSTIHMGDYLHAALALIRQVPGRKIVVARGKVASKTEQDVLRHLTALNIEHEVHRVTAKGSMKIIKTVRRGGLAILFSDLSRNFGPTTPVKVMDLDLNWVQGPVAISALSNAYLVPFVTYRDSSGRSTGECLPVIGPGLPRNPNGSDAVNSGVQALATTFEHYIKSYPTQWLRWHQIDKMISPPQQSQF